MKRYKKKNVAFLQYNKLNNDSKTEIAPFGHKTYSNLGIYEFTHYYDLLGEDLYAIKDEKNETMSDAVMLVPFLTAVKFEANIDAKQSISLSKAILLCNCINDLQFDITKYEKKKKLKLSEILKIYKVILNNPEIFGFNTSYSDSADTKVFTK